MLSQKEVKDKSYKQAVLDYYTYNEIKKDAEKKLKSPKEIILSDLQIGDTLTYEDLKIKVDYRKKETNVMNQEKLISTLKLIGQDSLVKTKVVEYVDEMALDNAVAFGELDPVLLQDCIETSVTGSLYVTKITDKKKGAKK